MPERTPSRNQLIRAKGRRQKSRASLRYKLEARTSFTFCGSKKKLLCLEFHEDGHVQPVLGFPQIRGEPWHEGAGRTANIIAEDRGRARGWRDTTWPREIRHVCRPMVVLPTERNILAGHPVKRPRHIPGL